MKEVINKFSDNDKKDEQLSPEMSTGGYWPFKNMHNKGNTSHLKEKFNDPPSTEEGQTDKSSPTIRRPYCRTSSTQKFIDKFNATAKQTDEELKRNPFSNTYEVQQFDKTTKDYARPPKGSKTEFRAKKAGNYITSEIIFLCEVINSFATGEVPNRVVKFGPLFYNYNLYSGSLVGMLIRARKYGLIDFEGEMLYQGQDNNKEIKMLKTIDDIKKCVRYSGDPVNCVTIVDI